MTLITRMNWLPMLEGDSPDVRQIPQGSVPERCAVIEKDRDGSIGRLNGGADGSRSLLMKPDRWADAERIDDKEDEEEPEERGQVATTTVVGLGLRSFRLLVHGESVALAGGGSKSTQVMTNRD